MSVTRVEDGYIDTEHNIKGCLDKGLAPRQLVSLLLKAVGMNTKEVSTEMNCSESTTNKRQQTINFKLNAKNTPQAISEAVRRGIIVYLSVIMTLFIAPSDEDENFTQELGRLRNPRPTAQQQFRTRSETIV